MIKIIATVPESIEAYRYAGHSAIPVGELTMLSQVPKLCDMEVLDLPHSLPRYIPGRLATFLPRNAL